MGLHGIGARPKTITSARRRASSRKHPWAAPKLSRSARVIKFVESLPVTSGPLAGSKLKLRSWQKKFIEAVYRTKNGKGFVRTAVFSMARKNGKTQLAAALALCALSGPEAESRGEVYSAANDRFQAGRIFSEMVAIITRVPWLDARINIIRFRKELEDLQNGSTFAALSADVTTKQGLSPSFVVYDELGSATSRELFDALDSAQGGRDQPLMMVISTQAGRDEAPLSTLIDYGKRILAGEITDPSFHLTLHAAPTDADPWAPATWRMANPAIGDFRSLEDVKRLARQAQRMPSAEASFRQFILNQRIDAHAQFITPGVWALGNEPVDTAQLKGRACFAGLDLAATRDLTCLCLAFADDHGGYDIVPYFWLPGDDLRDREDTDRVPYCQWRDRGFLLTVDGKTMDPAAVARKLAELHAEYRLQGIAFDRWRIGDLKRELANIGADDIPLVEHGMGFKDMSHAVNTLEKLAIDGKLRHGGNPILMWCISNARTTSDPAGNRKLDKSRSTGRIDGAVAAALALSIATRHEPEPEWTPFVEVI